MYCKIAARPAGTTEYTDEEALGGSGFPLFRRVSMVSRLLAFVRAPLRPDKADALAPVSHLSRFADYQSK